MRMKMQQQAEQRSIEQAFEDFIRYCNVKNLAKDSIIFYENCYKSFTRFLPKESYVSNITLHTIQDYILWQNGKSISAIAVNSNLRGVRAFLYYCMKLGYLPKFSIELVKAEKKVKQVYTDSELQLLLKKPNVKHCSFTEYRDWVVINYALATGNRVSTIINLKIQDVDFENGYITLVRTKNKITSFAIPMAINWQTEASKEAFQGIIKFYLSSWFLRLFLRYLSLFFISSKFPPA